MTMKDDGGAAFPFRIPTKYQGSVPIEANVSAGMSLRDWFAGQALAAVMSEGMVVHTVAAGKERGLSGPQSVAQACYDFADAMIEVRKS